MKLHLFYPENDLALARDIARYTAPPAAVSLRRSGATLPIWYGEAGDSFISHGVNAEWLRSIESMFAPGISPFNHQPADLQPAPWGWSKASRQIFSDQGFPASVLPSDSGLASLRQLSHRRTAAKVAEKLASALPFNIAPPAVELNTEDDIRKFVMSQENGTVVKLPWSSSGRGLVATDPRTINTQGGMFRGMLNRQASVMAEPRYTKLLDFAMLFTIEGGHCRFDGLSVFTNTQLGSYAGNTLATQEELEQIVCSHIEHTQFAAVKDCLPGILEKIAGGIYEGPLGVDMMAVDAAAYTLVPVVEINFRMTMGHLCRRFYNRFVEPGAKGTFRVLPTRADSPSGRIDAHAFNGRLCDGTLDLAQPGCDFSFLAELK